jgi:hypothetical protein
MKKRWWNVIADPPTKDSALDAVKERVCGETWAFGEEGDKGVIPVVRAARPGDDVRVAFVSHSLNGILEIGTWRFSPEKPELLRQLGELLAQKNILDVYLLGCDTSDGLSPEKQTEVIKYLSAGAAKKVRVFGTRSPIAYDAFGEDGFKLMPERDYIAEMTGAHGARAIGSSRLIRMRRWLDRYPRVDRSAVEPEQLKKLSVKAAKSRIKEMSSKWELRRLAAQVSTGSILGLSNLCESTLTLGPPMLAYPEMDVLCETQRSSGVVASIFYGGALISMQTTDPRVCVYSLVRQHLIERFFDYLQALQRIPIS